MASLIAFTSCWPSLSLINQPSQSCSRFPHTRNASGARFSGHLGFRKKRALTAVARAGPSTNSLLLAFMLPLSLLGITVFTSLRIGDKLDQKYLEEVAINEALREVHEEEEEDEGEDDADIVLEEELVTPRKRNRPIREV